MTVEPATDLAGFVERATGWLDDVGREFAARDAHSFSPFTAMPPEEESAFLARSREWQAIKHAAGWSGLSLATELGGQGLGRAEETVFSELEGRIGLPTHVLEVTLGMVLPTLVRWSPHRTAAIAQMVAGRSVWCQLFSEPAAGSDLASIRTSATQTPDGTWRVSGQKVWTSWAHFADRGYLLARTGGTRYHDLTAFEVDMAAPGVTVRRLAQVTGASTFNEVFLDDVELPADAVIGEVGSGWAVAMTTLMNERLAVGAEQLPYSQLRAEAARRGMLDDGVVRAALGDVLVRRRVVEQLRRRMLESVARGGDPGPEGSAGKLFLAESVVATASAVRQVVGRSAAFLDEWSEFALASPGIKIAGGTDEIQKNIIADRILGLPREPSTVAGGTT